ncbi:MAG: mannosyltransferase, partial [Saprospiraceae bacterium]|nr:mannosyltransferase [Saprospiraceae bacterium]
LKKWAWKKSLIFGAASGLMVVISFLPFYNPLFFNNLQNSLGLYFKKFEFNASLYYIVREYGFWSKGYNWGPLIPPYLNGIVILGIVGLFFSKKSVQPTTDFFKNCLWAFSIYLFCATTVHPWYGAFPVFLCLFTHWRFPIVWSYFIFLSYVHYSYPQPTENYWLIGVEYLAVLMYIIFEAKSYKIRQFRRLLSSLLT